MVLIPKIYFIVIQVIILVLFIVLGVKKGRDKYFLFSAESNFYLLMLGGGVVGAFFNRDHQVFCNPVGWSQLLLLFYFIYFFSQKLSRKIIGEFTHQLILGLGVFISVYLIGFGNVEYLIWSVVQLIIIVPLYFLSKYLNKRWDTRHFDFLNLFGVSVLFPYIIITWTLWQIWDKPVRYKVALSVMPSTIIMLVIGLTIRMNSIIAAIDGSENKVETIAQFKEDKIDNYLTELVLGAHWKYHTKICLYDGWRPPFHDPVLGFAHAVLYAEKQFHYELMLPDRIELYKQSFPDNETQFDCKCAKNERLSLL